MSVRVRTQIIVVASQDADEQQLHFAREAQSFTRVIETFEAEQSGYIEIDPGESDYVLEKGKVGTIQYFYIEVDREVIIKLDGEAVGHKIGSPGSGTMAKWCLRTTATSISVTNADPSVIASGSYFIAGSK